MIQAQELLSCDHSLSICNVADMFDQPIHIMLSDKTIAYVNKAWEKVYNHTADSVIGKDISNIRELTGTGAYYISIEDAGVNNEEGTSWNYYHLDTPFNDSPAVRALETGSKVTLFIHDSRNFSKVIVSSTPVFDENNNIRFVLTIIQNLTKIINMRDEIELEIKKNNIIARELSFIRRLQAPTIIGISRPILEIKELICSIKATDAPILITGESGTGKEVIAKEIHANSMRKEMPFIAVNCAAIPEHLLESELFGYEKGAFTGALCTKQGLFELAQNGTIMLDEIGDFPLSLQAKLLRVLQEHEFRHLGGTKTIQSNVRIISATNQNILQLISEGRFRKDLYYRLNVMPIHVPPLRKRVEDIPLLANAFLDRFNQKYKKNKRLSPQATLQLERYLWPGNVRELENIMERLIIIGESDIITRKNIAAALYNGIDEENASNLIDDDDSLKKAVDSYECQLIKSYMEKYKSTYKVAEALKSSQPTIARKIKHYGLNHKM